MRRWKVNPILCRAILMAVLPVLCCVVTCAAQGRGIGDVYLPGSEWNDELFYYKQVEGILGFGYPQGYFGFNESHALKASFAAWSPVLVLPWVLWGLLFGWGLLSPMICNIVLLTIAVFLFVWLARPDWKQTGLLALLFCLYTPFVRYMLSGMPEVICFSHLIVFYGLAVNYQKKESAGKLAGLFALSGLLTLMRPYMLLFLLLPVFFRVRAARRRGWLWQGILGSAAVSGAVLAVYVLIKHYLGAEYFHPLFFTDWLTTFFRRGVGAGFHNFFGTLYWKGKECFAYMREGVRNGLASGAFFDVYLVTMFILLGQSVRDWRGLRRKRKAGEAEEKLCAAQAQLVVEAHLAFCFLGMFFALLLMYKLTEGSKHLLTFLAAGVFVVAMMETRFYKKAALLGASFVFFFSLGAFRLDEYRIPFRDEERAAQLREWTEQLDAGLELVAENAPNFDNVVIWVFDEVDPKTDGYMEWQVLYALPGGFGISCCQKDYVLEHFEQLSSRYIAVQAGGETDRRCRDMARVAGDGDVVLYRMR